MGEQGGEPDQEAEAGDHDGEEASGEAGLDAGEDGEASEQVKDAGGFGPEHLAWRDPEGHEGGGLREGGEVGNTEGDYAESEEGARDSRERGGASGEQEAGNDSRSGQGELLGESAPGAEDAREADYARQPE